MGTTTHVTNFYNAVLHHEGCHAKDDADSVKPTDFSVTREDIEAKVGTSDLKTWAVGKISSLNDVVLGNDGIDFSSELPYPMWGGPARQPYGLAVQDGRE
jgi:hypothetical protein